MYSSDDVIDTRLCKRVFRKISLKLKPFLLGFFEYFLFFKLTIINEKELFIELSKFRCVVHKVVNVIVYWNIRVLFLGNVYYNLAFFIEQMNILFN